MPRLCFELDVMASLIDQLLQITLDHEALDNVSDGTERCIERDTVGHDGAAARGREEVLVVESTDMRPKVTPAMVRSLESAMDARWTSTSRDRSNTAQPARRWMSGSRTRRSCWALADQIGDGAGEGRLVEIEPGVDEALRHAPPSRERQSGVGAQEECAHVYEGLWRRRGPRSVELGA